MGGGGNSGNFFNPKNLIPTVLTGGLYYGVKELGASMKPPTPSTPSAPPNPDPAAYPHALDQDPTETAAQRQKKLAAMQFGFASTMTSKANSPAASLATAAATGLKTKTGQ